MLLDQAPFDSAHQAAAWAYATVSGVIVKISSVGTWGKKETRRGRNRFEGLDPFERHAQAQAIIFNHIDRLEGIYVHWVRAEFLPAAPWRVVDRKPGRRPLLFEVVWNRAVDRLTESVIAGLGTGVHKRRPYQWMVEDYFGARIGARRLRKEMQCRMEDALEHRRVARERLDVIGQVAMDMLANSLEEAGLVERDPYA